MMLKLLLAHSDTFKSKLEDSGVNLMRNKLFSERFYSQWHTTSSKRANPQESQEAAKFKAYSRKKGISNFYIITISYDSDAYNSFSINVQC